MSRPVYTGVLNQPKMADAERIAYEAYNGAKARSKKLGLPPPEMTTREFIGWWMESLKTFKGTVPSCGRFDHKRGYTWDNFEMQDMAANSREGMLRNKTNIKSKIKYGKKVFIKCKKSGEVIAESSSIRDVARIFDVSQRLVQKILRGTLPQSKLIPFTIVGAA